MSVIRPDKKLYIFDMDGTIYLGDRVFPFAVEYIRRLRADGRRVLVRLTPAGKALKRKAASVPEGLAGKLSPCRSLTPEASPALFATLDEIIETLR